MPGSTRWKAIAASPSGCSTPMSSPVARPESTAPSGARDFWRGTRLSLSRRAPALSSLYGRKSASSLMSATSRLWTSSTTATRRSSPPMTANWLKPVNAGGSNPRPLARKPRLRPRHLPPLIWRLCEPSWRWPRYYSGSAYRPPTKASPMRPWTYANAWPAPCPESQTTASEPGTTSAC